MLFSNFWEVTKSKLGNPYQLPKISMALHEFTSLLQQHLISTAIRPLDWIQTHPKSVPSSFLGASTSTRANNGNSRFSRQSHCWELMESQEEVWAHLDDLLHLLRQSWGPNRLLLMAVRQSRWILKQLCDADLKVNADKFDIMRTLTEYLEVLTSYRPQSNKA
jgi:hypothetical protein